MTRRDILMKAEYAELAKRHASLVTALAVLEQQTRDGWGCHNATEWADRLHEILEDHVPEHNLGEDAAVASLLNLRRRFAKQLRLAAERVQHYGLDRGLPHTVVEAIVTMVGDISVEDAINLIDREADLFPTAAARDVYE
jgi:hypothetical protein